MLNRESDNKQLSSTNESSHCIWMSAGVISFKLCPIKFDCEQCDFDAVMRQKKNKNQKPNKEI